tara:strand:- start:1055 stop:1588 length:534 start_codon:yes stop_codon:yes gene_type:complete
MKNFLKIKLLLIMTITGCNKNDNESDDSSNYIEVITHDIDAANSNGFYYNLSLGAETDSSDSWHISFQMIPVVSGNSTYMMPSLVLGEVNAAEYSNIAFENFEAIPSSFNQDYFQDASVVHYGGSNEVLSYNMQIHKVSVTAPERVFVFKDIITNSYFKVQFIEYVSGIISFKYSLL